MILFNKNLLNEYIKNDIIFDQLALNAMKIDKTFASHKWLLDSPPKRMIFNHVYKDLLNLNGQPKKILDVGGGYSSLSRLLIKNNNYELLDIMAHDSHDLLFSLENSLKNNFWINNDWYEFSANKYDTVVANDIFTNVDQRLELFLDKFLPICKEIRLTLTYYNKPRFYTVKRIDADEIWLLITKRIKPLQEDITQILKNDFSNK